MEISYAFFAEAAQVTSDGRLNILGADLHTISFQGNPPWVSGTLFFLGSIRFAREDCGHLYHLTADLLAPDGKRIDPHLEQDFVAPLPDQEDTLVKMGLLLQLTGVTFPAPGVFHLHIRVEDQERNAVQEKQVRLRIMEAIQQSQPG